jgi:hypothetical protein
MRTATGLALVAIGAILAFAVTAHPSFLNLQVAGWVIMLTGVAGLAIPRRGYGWLRRRVVVRRPRAAPAITGPTASSRLRPGRFVLGQRRWQTEETSPSQTLTGRPAPPEAVPEETVEEFYEE